MTNWNGDDDSGFDGWAWLLLLIGVILAGICGAIAGKALLSTVLIIGLGRAGVNHVISLNKLGIEALGVDSGPNPRRKPKFRSLSEALEQTQPQAAVIATPPDQHLSCALACRRQHPEAKLLIEKPLCDLGQLPAAQEAADELAQARICFNWRFHPRFQDGKPEPKRELELRSFRTRRTWPAWGLTIDHLAHSLDLVSYLSGRPLERLDEVNTLRDEEHWELSLRGRCGSLTIKIHEEVHRSAIPEVTLLICDGQAEFLNLRTRAAMFQAVWRSLLFGEGEALPTYERGLEVSRWLEAIVRQEGFPWPGDTAIKR